MIFMNPELERLVDAFWVPFCEEYGRLRQQRLNAFTGHLVDFLNDLLNYPLVRPWRESLDLFQEHYWQQIGLQLTTESYDRVAAFIERMVNDPRCHAHGPIQPDIAGQPPRRPPGGLVGTPKTKGPVGIRETEVENMRRFARQVAELEEKRIALTDEETSLYAAYRYENIRRQYSGERALEHPDFWHVKNAAFNRKLRGPSPRPTAARKPELAKAAETKSPETRRSHVVSVAPNVSGPSESGNKSADLQPVFVNGVEVAGPGPETTQSFRDKVQKSLEILDPRVARWWKAPCVQGQVRSRDATSWPVLWRRNYYSEVVSDQPIITVDKEFDAGQTAQAIIAEVTTGLFADSLAAFYRKYKFSQSGDWKEFREWQQRSVGEAARLASILAELYINSIATLTPSGDLVVTIGDIADRGPQWDQLISILPLLSYLPIGAIIISLGSRRIKLSKAVARELEAFSPAERKALLTTAAAAKTDDEAKAIIEREIAGRRGSKPSAGKGIAAGADGPGLWVKPKAMSPRARAYQTQITGREEEYLLNGVQFDGFRDGILLEAKGPGYGNFVKGEDLRKWFTGANDIFDQANRQVAAGGGVPIVWHVAEPELAAALDKAFKGKRIAIQVVHTPAK
ncbi:MAG TPA: Tox-REase-5 domain-containing protein [Pirellulales bacterium]|nr:Tox-REase-5 domain-containing protein [Pirellulales bacterium]